MATIIELRRSRATRARSALLTAGTVLATSFLALYGAAHMLAFAAQWHLMGTAGGPYSTTLLNGRIGVGDAGIRIEGLLWLVAAAGFMSLALRYAWTQTLERAQLSAVTGFSLALCIFGLPEAGVGVVVDLVILGLVILLPAGAAPNDADSRLIEFPAGNNRHARRSSLPASRTMPR